MLDTKKTDFYPPYLCASEELRDNPGQWQAYESQRNAVVLAGPGSGKTKTMTIKLARLLSEQVSSPQAICCITYSSECVRELLRRLQELGVEPGENLFVGTVHSFCLEHAVEPFRHLCENNLPNPFVVVPHSIKLKILHKALSFVVGVEERPSDWYQRVDAYRRTYIDRDTDEWRLTDAQCAEVAEKYEELLHAEGYIDFEDMIITGTRFIENNAWLRRVLVSKFPIFVVDEYQDLGVALHRMVTTLLDSGARLIAVGDPDQSIYDFAGARPELLIDLAKRQNVEKIELQFNYRSGDKLVAASLAALAEHRNYIAKGKHQGEIFFHHIAGGLDAQAEAICKEIVPSILTRNPDIKLGGIAVLYATQHDGTALVPFVESAGFDYVRLDQGAPYPKTPITRWLEDGANWCADGWKSNEPRLGNIINRWIGFNRRLLSEEERAQARSILIGFLTANRNPEINLLEWLKAFNTACLHQTLSNEPSLRD